MARRPMRGRRRGDRVGRRSAALLGGYASASARRRSAARRQRLRITARSRAGQRRLRGRREIVSRAGPHAERRAAVAHRMRRRRRAFWILCALINSTTSGPSCQLPQQSASSTGRGGRGRCRRRYRGYM